MRQKSDKRLKYDKDKQAELFPDLQAASIKKARQSFRQDMVVKKKFVLNLLYENLVLLFIIFIMLLVIFFSLGVEKGKRIVRESKKDVAGIIDVEPQVEKGRIEVSTPEWKDASGFENIGEEQLVKKNAAKVPVKPYTIQIIAFKKEKNGKVEKEVQRLKDEGYEAFVIPSQEWLQVCVGRYISKEESQIDFLSLKKIYPTC
jgi:hypothetical protein